MQPNYDHLEDGIISSRAWTHTLVYIDDTKRVPRLRVPILSLVPNAIAMQPNLCVTHTKSV